MALRAFGSGRVFGVTHGDPPYRVLALPGWMHTVGDWDGVLGALAAGGIGSAAFDLPGFGGAAPEPPSAMGSAGYAELVAPALADLADTVVVVGHSFGGRVALHLAAGEPDRVSALVLTGVPKLVPAVGPARKPTIVYRLARALNRRGVFTDSKMEQIRRRSGSEDYRNAASVTMRSVLVTVANESYESQLRALRCPVELVWGELDSAAPLDGVRRAASLLGDHANLTVLPGVDHFTPTKSPDALAAAIRRHVAA